MICTSVAGRNEKGIKEILSRKETAMAEIRLDLCPVPTSSISGIFRESDIPLIATCRLSDNCSEVKCLERLSAAITAGAAFADLEIGISGKLEESLINLCHRNGCRIIRSFHDFSGCPDQESLQSMTDKCLSSGADIVKIAVTARQDDVRWRNAIASLYSNNPSLEGRLIAFAMGECGQASRIDCLAMGAPFTYCSPDEASCTAPGQHTSEQLSAILYQDRKLRQLDIHQPAASKSYAVRAVIAAALANGTSTISGYTASDDSCSAVHLARSLGATVDELPGTLVISGTGARPGCLSVNRISCGESGLLTRIAAPLVSILSSTEFVLDGEKTLLGRDMKPLSDSLEAMGMTVCPNRMNGGLFLPFAISGTPNLTNVITIDGSQGSQVASGLLFSLPLLPNDTVLHINSPKSIPYLNITAQLLEHFGITINKETICKNGNCTMVFHIPGAQSFHPSDICLEPDWSGAAPFLVHGAIAGRTIIHGMPYPSLQADAMILDILRNAGAFVQSDTGNGHDASVSKSALHAFSVNLENAPDLFPAVAVLAAFCPGESRIEGTERLHSKESDRAEAIMEMLSQMGIDARINCNSMIICGHSLESRILSGTLPIPGEYKSRHDHRMAMALLIAESVSGVRISIDDTDCISKSYPGFVKELS